MEPHSLTMPTLPAFRAGTRRQPPPPNQPRLSIVIINYQSWNDTAQVVQQLAASPQLATGQAEITIIDNHSRAHPLAARLRAMPGVNLRRWSRNRGFARAVNEGCRLGLGDWFLLLNPDVTLDPRFLDEALARIDQFDDRVGIVGFALRNSDDSHQLSTGPFPSLGGTLCRMLLPRHCRKYRPTPETMASSVDWATGCCLLIRRSCWEELRGFDPNFFLYYEDVDLCRRARAKGWTVRFDPSLSLIHHRPLHARKVPPHLRLITRHALLTYARKHWAPWQNRVLAGIVRMEAWVRQGFAWFKGKDDEGALFHQLGRLAGELARGDRNRAARRLRRVVEREEATHAAGLVHRRSQP